jgi:predicted nucleic acid-binding protein
MNLLFADTFYWFALLNRNDAAHARVSAFAAENRDRLLTTAWVLTEWADGMAAPGRRRSVLPFLQSLRADPLLTIVPPSADLFDRGLDLYDQRPDKEWSLTDCISFVVMQDHGITEALTGDHHFEQAGFVALLK